MAFLLETVESAFPKVLAIKKGIRPPSVCYTIILVITETQFDNLSFTQSLHCHLSFWKTFVVIYGRDDAYITKGQVKYPFGPIITTSPVDIYEQYFNALRLEIEKIFPTYRFVPFVYLKKRIKGLEIFRTFLKENQFSSVFQALFTPENLTDYNAIGDLFYK